MAISLSRRRFLKASIAGVGAAAFGAAPHADRRRRPDIVLILVDDLGYGDLGCYGCADIPTPNIDSIAQNGVRFTDGYVCSPVCSPSRAGLLTGRYPQRFGHEFNLGERGTAFAQRTGLPRQTPTLAEALRSTGYKTACIGKWHLGMRDEYHPQERGFDEFYGFLHHWHSYSTGRIYRGKTAAPRFEYLTNQFALEAIALVRRWQQPWFLYLSYNAPHSPLHALPEYAARFGRLPEPRRSYAAIVSCLDDSIGGLVGELDRQGVLDRTLLVFLSDNGGSQLPMGDTRWERSRPSGISPSSNSPLRGWKGQLYEGGIRVPFLAQWPGMIPAGTVDSRPVSSLDLFGTCGSVASAELDDGLDGVDLLGGKLSADRPLFWRSGDRWAVRRGKYKLVKQQSLELFDLEADISEEHDLTKDHLDTVAELRSLWEDWNGKNVEPLWDANGIRLRE